MFSLFKKRNQLNDEVLSPEDIMELETIFDDFGKHDPEMEAAKAEFVRDQKREDGVV